MTERSPDIADDPRQQSTGEGYPETNPEGQSPVEGTEQGPEADTGKQPGPDQGKSEDDSPSNATGNPGAAGG